LRLDQKCGYPDWSPLVEPLFRTLRHGLVMKHLDGLDDRPELIAPWIGLGLAAAAFGLALWLLPL
jgi:hypothetical protein